MRGAKTKHFVIGNQLEELTVLAEKIEDMASEWNIPESVAMNINLAVEEAVSNIIFYAFADKNKHEIRISVSFVKNRLTISISDDGLPFNPLEKEQPDITLSADERPIGGLGIFLILNIMDEASYERKENQNILTLQKII